ncbi:MAG: MltA domain-containing protein [Acidobacteriota bacterium]
MAVSEWTSVNSLNKTTVKAISDNGDKEELIRSIDHSLNYIKKIPDDTIFQFGSDKYNKNEMEGSLKDFRTELLKHGLSEKFFRFVRENYNFYEAATGKVLYTGYFEALLKGSMERTEQYKYPLYRKPLDLVTIELSRFSSLKNIKGLPKLLRGKLNEDNRITPYYSRSEIDSEKALLNKDLELIWTNNPVDLFFLHIQGSGIIELEGGDKIRVNYAGTNGHPYRAIGRFLVEKGICTYKDLSMQFIKKYIKENPDEAEEIFNYNPSYIFFRKVEEGPVGSLGVPVTPYRSIATDKYIFPKGSICYISTKLPEFDKNDSISGRTEFSGFALNQDTGGAIRSPGRADLFTGNGKKSELTAGHLKEEGKLYFLIKKKEA